MGLMGDNVFYVLDETHMYLIKDTKFGHFSSKPLLLVLKKHMLVFCSVL